MPFSLRKLFRNSSPPGAEPVVIPPDSHPITYSETGDVFIVGFPKSGHTWMQNLMAHALYGNEAEPPLPKPVVKLIPDIHYLKFYQRVQPPMFFKAHSLPTPQFKRVIYLLRDGRDVMVSYWHYLQATQGRQLDFLKLVKTADGFFPSCKWHEHIEQWLTNPFEAELLTVRYENLKQDGIAELERVFGFVKIDRTRAQLERAVARSSFENMQRHEIKNWKYPPQWPEGKRFMRRGETGSYRDEMPTEVQAAFMAEAAPMMRRLGYISD